ncbi:zinc finger protein 335-like [Amphibalanus amphitrite]|uniref:zinc finger protein 335-like n=1 Tax=Amphibalanus amphitrite TaxID=1232801 RepID=UPI001C91AE44|nr:zinc finger protein 335-like [Amphibalanus amphitrite]
MDGGTAPSCGANQTLEHLSLSTIPVTQPPSATPVRSDGPGLRASHPVSVCGPPPAPAAVAATSQQQQQVMENRVLGELPADLFCGGPDPSRIPGLVIEQVSVSVDSSSREPPPPPSEEVIVVDVDLGTPVSETGVGRPLLQFTTPVSVPCSTGADGGGGQPEARPGRRGREPALPSMETLRPSGGVTLTPVSLPAASRSVVTAASVAAPVVPVSSEPNYDVIMSSCLPSGPLVQLNNADLEVLPLPASHAPLDVTSFCTDSSDGIGSPPKLELLGAVPLSLPQVETPLSTAAVVSSTPSVVVSSAGRLPPPYPQRARAAAGTARLSAICQQLVERVEAHKCSLCSYVSLQREDVTAHLLASHRPELERRRSGERRRTARSPPSRVVSATSVAHCLVDAHGRVRVQPRPAPQLEVPVVASREISPDPLDIGRVSGAVSPTEPRFDTDSGITDSDDLEVTWMGGGMAATDDDPEPAEPEPTEPETNGVDGAVTVPVSTATTTASAAEEEEEEEDEDDPESGPRESRRLLGIVSSMQPSVLQGVLAGKKKGRPRDSRSLGISTLAGGKGRPPQRQLERALGLLLCKEKDCGVRLRDSEKLDQHQRCHLSDSPNEFGCTECNHTTKKWRPMSLHLWREHQIECDLFHCDRCNYKTARYSQLINVHMPTHGQVRNYSCVTCHKAFKTAKQLQNHRAKHRHKQDPAYIESCRCNICNSILSDRRALALHKQMVHEKKRQFQCKACGHVFSCRSSLVMHERQHSGQKPFVCEHCPYSSTDHNTMRRHKMRHTGERPYKCPHCDYSCIQSTTYKKHLRDKHPGEAVDLIFSCHVCMFKTIQRSAYVRHMQDHPDAGPPPDKPPGPQPAKPPAAVSQQSAPAPLTLLQPQGELQQHVVRVQEAPPPAQPPLPVVSAGSLKMAPVAGGLTTATVYQLVPQSGGRPPVMTTAQVQVVAPIASVGRPARATRGSRSAGARRAAQ